MPASTDEVPVLAHTTRKGPPVEVHFEPETEGISLLHKAGRPRDERQYDFRDVTYRESRVPFFRVCKDACVTTMATGTYQLALAKGRGDLVVAGDASITGPSTIRASYTDYSTLRYVGATVGIAGTAAGVIMIIASTHAWGVDTTMMGAGFGTLLPSAAVGLILGLHEDGVHIDVSPLVLAPPAASEGAPPPPQGANASPHGAALRVSF
jgi:hypothetical protein